MQMEDRKIFCSYHFFVLFTWLSLETFPPSSMSIGDIKAIVGLTEILWPSSLETGAYEHLGKKTHNIFTDSAA